VKRQYKQAQWQRPARTTPWGNISKNITLLIVIMLPFQGENTILLYLPKASPLQGFAIGLEYIRLSAF